MILAISSFSGKDETACSKTAEDLIAKIMSRLSCFFLLAALMFHRQVSCAWEDDSSEEEPKIARQVVDNSFRSPYRFAAYPWQQWSSPYASYQPRYQPSFRQDAVTVYSQSTPGFTQSCKSTCTGERGNCFDAETCSSLGGRASGNCRDGRVCCINVVNTCHGKYSRHSSNAVTLNNTYWQSSLRPIPASSSCTLTVKLDTRLPDNTPAPVSPLSICQVRLDFLVFTISQPDSESVCSGDYFEVAGATNTVPNICGFNDGQHMYLHVPPSDVTPTDLQLTFNFGASDIETRAWNILISKIPCGPRLAPAGCLQYFTTRSGVVQTFNWRDVAGTATRQLANQDYSICFRSAPYSPRQLCLTPCTVVTTQKPFSLSTPSVQTTVATTTATSLRPDVSQVGSLDCNNDFVVIPGGFNIGNPAPVPNMAFDRYCGEKFNALPGNNASTTVCTTATPFRVLYRTNRDETLTSPTADSFPANSIPVNGNRGFCLNFRLQ
uniref:CUB domain-containing protein n=1 Tax=Daphnia magna TaxID=35525 RepID=A0A0P5PZ80_9CRUS